MVNNIPVNGWPQLKDLEAVQPTLDRLDKIEAWKRTVKVSSFTGEEITIPNALALPARSLITEINAIQDLHGYDHPWVGGAGKNKLPMTVSAIKAANTSGTWNGNVYSIANGTIEMFVDSADNVLGFKAKGTFNTTVTFAIMPSANFGITGILNGAPATGSLSTYEIQVALTGETYHDYGSGTSAFNWNEAQKAYIVLRSGYATPTDGIIFRPMFRLSTETDPTFAPYSNICPISGRTESTTVVHGEPLLNINSLRGVKTSVSVSGDKIRITATEAGTWVYAMADNIAVNPNKGHITYSCRSLVESKASLDDQLSLAFYDANNTFISRTNFGSDLIKSIAIPPNAAKISVYAFVSLDASAAVGDYIDVSGLYLEYGAPTVNFTIQLGQTVYGADINWDTGVMTITHVLDILSGLTWIYDSSNQRFYAQLSNNTLSTWDVNALCSCYDNAKQSPSNNQFAIGWNNIFIKDTRYNNVDTFKATLTDQTAMYELATPTTIQLTPTQLQMLKGYNRVTLSDGYGTIELKALTGANWS